VKTKTPQKRPKPPVIQLAEENAPWVIISKASSDTGLTELLIRGIKIRRFGNADYVRPTALNSWILNDEKEDKQS